MPQPVTRTSSNDSINYNNSITNEVAAKQTKLENELQALLQSGSPHTEGQIVKLISQAIDLDLNTEHRTAFVEKLIDKARAESFLKAPVEAEKVLNTILQEAVTEEKILPSLAAEFAAHNLLGKMESEAKAYLNHGSYQSYWEQLLNLFVPHPISIDSIKKFGEVVANHNMTFATTSRAIYNDFIKEIDNLLNSDVYSDEQKQALIHTKIEVMKKLTPMGIDVNQHSLTYECIQKLSLSLDADVKRGLVEKLDAVFPDIANNSIGIASAESVARKILEEIQGKANIYMGYDDYEAYWQKLSGLFTPNSLLIPLDSIKKFGEIVANHRVTYASTSRAILNDFAEKMDNLLNSSAYAAQKEELIRIKTDVMNHIS